MNYHLNISLLQHHSGDCDTTHVERRLVSKVDEEGATCTTRRSEMRNAY